MKTIFNQKRSIQRIDKPKNRRINFLTFLTVLLLVSMKSGLAQLPTGFIAKKLTSNNVSECVTMSHAPDGRIFMAERGGNLKLLNNGVVSTIHSVSTTTAAEQGLLGIALHSNFSQNGKLYLYYTDPAITKHYLDVIVLNSSSQVTSNTRLMEFDPITNGYHNGGAMVFKDGLLYICIGESNTPGFAQDLTTYRGKVLRLQDDGTPAPGNPYYNTAGANRQQKSIWAIGMRNPWYMSMDPQTKKIYNINVGGGYEEINDLTNPDATRNYNYGWGTDNKSGPEQNPATTILPIFAYNRNVANWNANTCAITSGVAFNPPVTNYPAQYKNKFYFGDWCTDWLRSIDLDNPSSGTWQENFPTGFPRILGLSVGIDGNLYYSDYTTNGNIWRIEYTLTQTPQIVNQPSSQTVYATEPVTFSVTATGSNPITYQWQKNNVNIPGATGTSYTINSTSSADAGSYTVIVTNSVTSITSNAAVLTVNPYNAPPVAKITTPTSSTTWSVNEPVSYAGTGTDTEDGTLPASSFVWEVKLFHKDCPTCEHSHPGPNAPDGVKTGTFTAINGGETSSNIWLRIYLTVTDSQGRIGKDSVDIIPNKVNITATTNFPGLEIVVGLGQTTPYTKAAVVNANIDLQALTPQVIGNTVYTFESWTHGGPANQKINVPAVNTTYNANYTASTISATNLALNKNAIASTPTNPADALKAVDGNTTSRWESAFADPQWIYVDLGATYTITRVKILWETAMAKDYRIEASNDINNWGTPIKNISNNSVASNDWTGLTGVGRYVRIYGTTRTTGYGYSIYELEVYGAPTSGGGNISPAVSITAPANNATFAAPASVNITANATDSDGTVSQVEFYNGAILLGTDNTAPYSFAWNNVAAGNYSITAKATDNNGSATTSSVINIVVSNPSTTNLALNKPAFSSSVENAANAANYAVDGIANTRWSSAFSDPQWMYVDLGAAYNINRVKITWEAAKGKDFQIQISNDINNWGTAVKTITNNNALVNDYTDISATGRYVRIYGTARTTVYGYSIFELEVYGTPAGGNISPAVSITSPTNNSSFSAPASVTITANATDSDGTISNVEFYNGITLLGSDNTAPYSFTWNNIAAGNYSITAKATDNTGASSTSDVINIIVTAASGTNLALNKPAFSSSVENANNAATYAVDGIANTRWSSAFADPQWIYVDLGAIYNINRVKITWEAAKGKDYLIQISNDINNWGTAAKTITNNNALINDHTDITATGRYVRIYGTARTTGYGYSIFELEVYGTSAARFGSFATEENLNINTSLAYPNPATNYITLKNSNFSYGEVKATFTDSKGNLILEKIFQNRSESFEEQINISELPAGSYTLKLSAGDKNTSQLIIKQ